MDLTDKVVVIIGPAASGKSWLADQLHLTWKHHKVFHSDDYMSHGFEQSLYVMMDDIQKHSAPCIVEGVLGYRLLRKGVELDNFYPDVVIEMMITDERMEKTYNEDRDPAKLKGAMSQKKANATVLEKYQVMILNNDLAPDWIQFNNDY